MQEQPDLLQLLESLIGWPEAFIVGCVTLIVMSCLLIYSSRLRNFFAGLNIRLPWGKGQVQFGPAGQPSEELVEEESAASVEPPASEAEHEQKGLADIRPQEEESSIEDTNRHGLLLLMAEAGYEDRDPEKIEAAYQELKSRQKDQKPDEFLETYRSRST